MLASLNKNQSPRGKFETPGSEKALQMSVQRNVLQDYDP